MSPCTARLMASFEGTNTCWSPVRLLSCTTASLGPCLLMWMVPWQPVNQLSASSAIVEGRESVK